MHSFDRVLNHLKCHEVRYALDKERGAIAFRSHLGRTVASCSVLCRDEHVRLDIYAEALCPKARITELGRFVLAVNTELGVGRWDLEQETGSLKFVACVDFEPGGLTEGMVATLIARALYAFDGSYPEALQVMFSGVEGLCGAGEALADGSEGLMCLIHKVIDAEWAQTMESLMRSDYPQDEAS